MSVLKQLTALRGEIPPVEPRRPRWYTRGTRLSTRATVLLGTAVFGACLGLFLLRFLVPVPVGGANQGDGARATCTVGMTPATHGYPRFQSFLLPELQASHADCAKNVVPYWTSQTSLLDLARPVTHLLGLRGAINLLAVGMVCLVFASAAIAALAVALRVSLAARLAIAALVWLIVADSAYFDYFPSPLGEGTGLLGILLVCAGIPLLGRGLRAGLPGLVLVGGGGMLAVGAKTQLLVLVAPLVLVLLLRTVKVGSTRHRLARLLVPRALGAVAAVAVVAVGGLSYHSQQVNDAYVRMNPVDTIFTAIVDGKHDTAADLKFLGLPQQWSKYAGYTWWLHGQAISRDPLYPQYENKLTNGNVARFWAAHPDRTVSVLQTRGQQLLGMRPDYVGSYLPAAGHPERAQEHRVTVVSSVVTAVKPAGLFLLVPVWAAGLWLGVRALRRGLRAGGTNLDRSLGTLFLFLVFTAVSQYLLAALGEAIENEKHMVFAAFSTLMTAPVLIAALANRAEHRNLP